METEIPREAGKPPLLISGLSSHGDPQKALNRLCYTTKAAWRTHTHTPSHDSRLLEFIKSLGDRLLGTVEEEAVSLCSFGDSDSGLAPGQIFLGPLLCHCCLENASPGLGTSQSDRELVISIFPQAATTGRKLVRPLYEGPGVEEQAGQSRSPWVWEGSRKSHSGLGRRGGEILRKPLS